MIGLGRALNVLLSHSEGELSTNGEASVSSLFTHSTNRCRASNQDPNLVSYGFVENLDSGRFISVYLGWRPSFIHSDLMFSNHNCPAISRIVASGYVDRCIDLW